MNRYERGALIIDRYRSEVYGTQGDGSPSDEPAGTTVSDIITDLLHVLEGTEEGAERVDVEEIFARAVRDYDEEREQCVNPACFNYRDPDWFCSEGHCPTCCEGATLDLDGAS